VRFEDAAFAVKLVPGRDGRGGIVKGWYDAIKMHDLLVKRIEEKMDEVDEKKRQYLVRKRVSENHEIAWGQFMKVDEGLWNEYKDLNRELKEIKEVEDIKKVCV
jgi:hypothetical protein